jgi:CBS domain containing-hemolysin-like protein
MHDSLQDKIATGLAIFVLFLVPIVGIALFWMVHIIPEKIAEKRHHPQKDAIKVLCLLSLVFGGMLWPFAWLWAYSRPVLHKLAYGTDKHEDYYREGTAEAEAPAENESLRQELLQLRRELEALSERGELSDSLQQVRRHIADLERRHLLSHSSSEGVH